MKPSSLLLVVLPAALLAPGVFATACSSSSSDTPPRSASDLDSGAPPTRDAGLLSDADTGTFPILPDDAGHTTTGAGALDASALTCPGPSFDAGASLAPSIPGHYVNCAAFGGGTVRPFEGSWTPVTLDIAEGDAGLTATYAYGDAGGGTLDFEPTSGSSATLAPALQNVEVPIDFDCFASNGNPGLPTAAPGILTAASGALTYDEGSVFLSLLGVTSSPTPPDASCGFSTGEGALSFLCDRGDDAGAPAGNTSDAGPTGSGVGFVPGNYACDTTTSVGTLSAYSSGVMTLVTAAGEITATYGGDARLSGTLHFGATSDTTANPATDGQTLMASTSAAPGAPSEDVIGVTAASLTMNCGTLFLTFAGAVVADDTGGGPAPATGALTCTRQ